MSNIFTSYNHRFRSALQRYHTKKSERKKSKSILLYWSKIVIALSHIPNKTVHTNAAY